MKALLLGLFTALVSFIIFALFFGLHLEENFGLGLLFKLRGRREVPSEVIIINIDRASSYKLNLPDRLHEWPRSLHAHLIENLAQEGAAVITFDIIFDEERDRDEDRLLAQSTRKARNVVFCEYLEKKTIPYCGPDGSHLGNLNIEEIVRPIPLLTESAAGLAPFPLPKIPVRVNQYWPFKTSAGDAPTLPSVAFQVFSLKAYEEFAQLLNTCTSVHIDNLPQTCDDIMNAGRVEKLVHTLRGIFQKEPEIAETLARELNTSQTLSGDLQTRQILASLIKMYQSSESQYLNFYGPPGTIPTVPYYEVLQSRHDRKESIKDIDFTGKAVFIGNAEVLSHEQKDGFYTVFSQSNGLHLSGVEIAATAFANILEGLPIKPLNFPAFPLLILAYGISLGMISFLFPPIISAVSIIGMNTLYLFFALYQFKTNATWYPLIVPLMLQTPIAFIGAVIWKYVGTKKEQQTIMKAFSYYLPKDNIHALIKNVGMSKRSEHIVYSTCLYTDIAQFTRYSETIDPTQLKNSINQYFEVVFEPIKKYGGIVSNVVADSVLALWVTAYPDANQRKQACNAALEVAAAVKKISTTSPDLHFTTRIGLTCGHIFLGNIGGMDHYEYRPIGDIVNTTTRIEGLNKYLGSQILISEKMMEELDGFLTRLLGKFLLYGKSKPIVVHELLCRSENGSKRQRSLCEDFNKALDAFQRQSWEEALERFHDLIKEHGDDGPSRYYNKLAERYKENGLDNGWDGIIRMEKK
ncbi:MAG: CHASE2 domain-containing protein [bacterium]